ncbi:hypothetical protein Vretimale_2002 [Volvox reticuliferus]|nr:hypothetical protein Vretimale_2002 [Volvox reticuliferus]
MWDMLSNYYSFQGPLGAWTPAVAIILNTLGVALGFAVTKLISLLLTPTYDLCKIPSPPVGDPILGHVKYFLRPDYHRIILKWTQKYGSIFRIRLLTQWAIVITDPATAAQVLATVPGRTHNYTLTDEVLGGPGKVSMFGTRDEAHWRNVRKATAPAFSMTNVRRYFSSVLDAAGELLSWLDRDQAEKGYVDLEPHLQRLMLRATLEGLLEVPDARHRPGFDELANRILLLMEEATNQISDPVRTIWYRTPLAPLLSKHMAKCHRAQREVVAFHTTTAARLLSRPDPSPENTFLWACLHRLRHPTTGRRLNASQLYPEVGLFTTAGFDTTSSTLGWCLYAASVHPEQQERVAEELWKAGVFGKGAVVVEEEVDQVGAAAGSGGGGCTPRLILDPQFCPSVEELARLPLLNAFINEAMRLYPATAVSGERLSSERPITVGGFTLPGKMVLWTVIYGIHTSEHNWDEPEVFRMDRWLEDPQCAFARGRAAQPGAQAGGPGDAGDPTKASPAPRRFLPFGDGPKNCVGQNFATVVVRAIFALLLSRYRVSLHPDMGIELPEEKEGGEGGFRASKLAAHTAALTQVAVVTKLTKLRVVLSRRNCIPLTRGE